MRERTTPSSGDSGNSRLPSGRLIAGTLSRLGARLRHLRTPLRPRTPRAGHGPQRLPPQRGVGRFLNTASVAGQVFFLQVIVAVLLITAAVVALILQTRHDSEADAQNRSLAAAKAFAAAPGVVDALRSPRPTQALQPRVEEAWHGSGLDFVAVMAPDGTRYADTDERLIGTRAQDLGDAPEGEAFTGIFAGQPGDAARALAPVTDADGSVVGLVGTGVGVGTIGNAVEEHLPALLGSAGAALVLATGSAALVSGRLRRQTRGIGPVEMTRMYEHHHAVLHAAREGVLIVREDGLLVLANDEARRLLDLPAGAEGRHIAEVGLEAGIVELLASNRVADDEVHLSGGRLVAVNTRPTAPPGTFAANVATLRDTTELRRLSGTAEVARERLSILYDAGLRIGTTLDVVRTAEELADVAVPRFADFVTVELLDPVLRGEEPTGAQARMRRAAISGVSADHPFQPVGDPIWFVAPNTPTAAALDTGHPVLEPDLTTVDDWRAQDPAGARDALDFGVHSLVAAPLRARGVVLGMANFWRSRRQEAFDEEDLSFADELAARAAVAIDNARRFTREHSMAVTLQRSLLPHVLPQQSAVDVAWRYLPAEADVVGGDWFDVIPLSGARVALVVGDVIGHGMHAAATMGRLRTAVHNFSALELSPDEILTRLDDLIGRIETEETREEASGTITGATCLYAIYDPVSGRCRLATAGHYAPALVYPAGDVHFPEVPVSPPLGLNGVPFESADLHLPEGSRFVLYTDGLIENRERDIDTGLGVLRDVLAAGPDRTPEETCQAVFGAMLPPHRDDDVALMVARTRMLEAWRVAEWDVPRDPAAVAPIRSECMRQLERWGLEEIGFAAELVLSELLTNAIRYADEPIHVRLLYENRLICEVSDGTHTSPHLRRAGPSDEGGRGLFLVTQLADRWGTRYTSTGKTIWTEQPLTLF